MPLPARHSCRAGAPALHHMHNNNSNYRYNGYSVSPSAHRLPDGWFAANLLLIRGDFQSAGAAQYKFDALDYFGSETQAVGHAATWAREWVDSRG